MSEESSSASVDSPANAAVMARLLELENRTGYRMQQFNGQRKYWNPNWVGDTPPRGCEVFVGKIPRELYEDELVPVFEKIGKLYEMRLMMDFSGYNRGYAFVTYTTKEDAAQAISLLDNYEIRPGKRIGVCISVDNCRLFVGGIPKDKSQEEIRQAMREVTDDVCGVIVFPGAQPVEKNRGFAFVEFKNHRAAAMARRKLIPGRITLFGCEVAVDWAEPETEVTADLSNLVKNVYVRNLKTMTSEFAVWAAFNAIRPGRIETVKKIENRDFAFVHFYKREDALYAVQMMNGQMIDGQEIQASIAKPNAINSGLRHANNNLNTLGKPLMPAMYNQRSPLDLMNRTNGAPLQQNFNHTIFPPHNTNGMYMNQPKSPPMSMCNPGMMPPTTGYQNHYCVKPPAPSMGNASWKSALDQNVDKRIKPVITLQDLAGIKCPVTLLSELQARLNTGSPPTYKLYIDPQVDAISGARKYIYRVSYMGSIFTPPTASASIEEAKRIAAAYVISEVEPMLLAQLGSSISTTRNELPYNGSENGGAGHFAATAQYTFGPSGDNMIQHRNIENISTMLTAIEDFSFNNNNFVKIDNPAPQMGNNQPTTLNQINAIGNQEKQHAMRI